MAGNSLYGRRRPRRSGQVLIIALLGMTLLVALIFYVYNTGDQVNRRLALQNTADSVAVSGGGWMARSMNLIAANNVAQTRLMALAWTLDSLPLAAEMTVAEETQRDSLPIALRRQLDRGIPHRKYEVQDFLRKGLEEIYKQMNRDMTPGDSTHLEFIEAVDEYLDQKNERSLDGSFDVKAATEWYKDGQGSGQPQGSIWQAVVALDEFSQAARESAGLIAARSSARFGRANSLPSRVTAFLVPVLPEMPAYRGRWWDFKPLFLDHLNISETDATYRESRVVERLRDSGDVLKEIEKVHARGGAIPNFAYPYRLGPFARCWHWRHYWHEVDAPWWEGGRGYRVGYTTYGPLVNAIQTVLGGFGLFGSHGGLAFTSRMPFHLRRIATLKLAYGFGLPGPQEIQYADPWITKYEDAMRFVEEGVPVDNSGGGFRPVGNWTEAPLKKEHDGSSLQTSTPGSTATFTPDLPAQGGYHVEVYIGETEDKRRLDKSAKYTIVHRDGATTVTKDQNSMKGEWVSLGTYNFLKGAGGQVILRRDSSSGATVADAVRLRPVALAKGRRPRGARDKEQVVLRTRYYRVGVTSSVHWDHPEWLDDRRDTYELPPEQHVRFHSSTLHDSIPHRGTNVGDPLRQPLQNWCWEPDGWVPIPRKGRNVEKLMDHVWVTHSVNRRVIHYQPFMWPPRPIVDQAGNIIGYIYYTLYHYSWYVWGGIEIRDPVVISDPLAGTTPEQRPAPILMDVQVGNPNRDYTPDHDEGFRRDRFTFMGVAGQPTEAAVWAARFRHVNPMRLANRKSMAALAQSEVFNNRSFDLWTQEWRVQLVPLTKWDQWIQKLDQGVGNVEALGGLGNPQDVENIRQYMVGLPQQLAEQFRSH